MKLNELKKDLLKRADVRAEYDALAEEFSIAEALIRARTEADMTQTEVAERMHTSQSQAGGRPGQPLDEGAATLRRRHRLTAEDQPGAEGRAVTWADRWRAGLVVLEFES